MTKLMECALVLLIRVSLGLSLRRYYLALGVSSRQHE